MNFRESLRCLGSFAHCNGIPGLRVWTLDLDLVSEKGQRILETEAEQLREMGKLYNKIGWID